MAAREHANPLELQQYLGDFSEPVDEDAYLRDFVKAVIEKNLQYVKFVVPIIKEQRNHVFSDLDDVGHYFEISTEESYRYNMILEEGLRLASHHGALSIVEYLLDQGVFINGKDRQGNTPLFKACERKQLPVIKKLLECGSNVNITNGVGSTALQWVARRSDMWQVVDMLLAWSQTDRDDASHKQGKTALHCAAELDESGKNVQLLLMHHASVNVQSKDGMTPLHLAVERDIFTNARQLIRQGAFLNMKEDKLGCAPLHIAAQLNYVDMVLELIESGADVNAKDNFGLTPKQRMFKYNCLSPGRKDINYDRIVFLLDNAHLSYARQRETMLLVFADVCEMIPYDSWKPLKSDIFGSDTLADDIQKKIVECDPDISLPVIIYKTLCEWLKQRVHVATFWVFMKALQDQQLHYISDKMIESRENDQTQWDEDFIDENVLEEVTSLGTVSAIDKYATNTLQHEFNTINSMNKLQI